MSKLIRWSPLALLTLLPVVLLATPLMSSSPKPATAAQEGGYVGWTSAPLATRRQ